MSITRISSIILSVKRRGSIEMKTFEYLHEFVNEEFLMERTNWLREPEDIGTDVLVTYRLLYKGMLTYMYVTFNIGGLSPKIKFDMYPTNEIHENWINNLTKEGYQIQIKKY